MNGGGHLDNLPDLRALDGEGGWREKVEEWGAQELMPWRRYPKAGLRE